MKVLLTGTTGNLGFEIAHSLNKREVEVLPVVRSLSALEKLNLPVENVVEADLTEDSVKIDSSEIGCIIHSAGNVHFEKSGNLNSKMMRTIIGVAKNLGVPIYYISTAFLWREPGNKNGPRNAYENDKLNSEDMLCDSGVPHTIFRPSVLVGSSKTGKLINWTGYYLLVGKFLEAAQISNAAKIRFPVLIGTSNMIPVDQAAAVISKTVTSGELNELVYVTNPKPPKAQWVLDTTLKFFGVRDKFEFLDMDFADYEKIQRTRNEDILYLAGKYFSPYWALSYNFPESGCEQNLITEEYLNMTLRSFQDLNNTKAV